MTTNYYRHPICLEHDPGPRHPESPERLRAVEKALAEVHVPDLKWLEAPKAKIGQIARVHPESHVQKVLESVPKTGYLHLDPDTVMSPATGEAALHAAGALVAAVDAVAAGTAQNAFCAVRPCGHHAEATRPMGFCIFNNVAIGALHAHIEHRYKNIAVVDFDVHHGNGTQESFRQNANLFFASSHQYPFYPGTGMRSDIGVGNIINEPLSEGAGSNEFRASWKDRILPALMDFNPDFLLISAGFDAHESDPLAGLNLTDNDFQWVTKELLKIAKHCCDGRVVSVMEGGYNLEVLGQCVVSHVRELTTA